MFVNFFYISTFYLTPCIYIRSLTSITAAAANTITTSNNTHSTVGSNVHFGNMCIFGSWVSTSRSSPNMNLVRWTTSKSIWLWTVESKLKLIESGCDCMFALNIYLKINVWMCFLSFFLWIHNMLLDFVVQYTLYEFNTVETHTQHKRIGDKTLWLRRISDQSKL